MATGEKEQSNEYWKKTLSQEGYDALRLGKVEEKNTGKYVKTKSAGMYLCAGCLSPVLHSCEKVQDDSGYATFTVSQNEEGPVRIARTYTAEGEEITCLVCNACSGVLGRTSNDVVRSADNLEQGTTQDRLVHVNSNAVILKKAFTPINYPLWYVFIAGAVALLGVLLWSKAEPFLQVAKHENVQDTVRVWVDDREVVGTTVHLTSTQNTIPVPTWEQKVFFIVLSQEKGASEFRLPLQPVDILWLDVFFKVVAGERGVYAQSSLTTKPPEGARFGVVTQGGLFPDKVFSQGYEIIIVDKTELF